MNPVVTILENAIQLLKESGESQENIKNRIDALSQQVDKLSKRRPSSSDDPSERSQYQAVSANISTEIASNNSGKIYFKQIPNLIGNVESVKIDTNLGLNTEQFFPSNIASEFIPLINSPLSSSNPIASEDIISIYADNSEHYLTINVPTGHSPITKIYSMTIKGKFTNYGRWKTSSGQPTGSKKIYLIVHIR